MSAYASFTLATLKGLLASATTQFVEATMAKEAEKITAAQAMIAELDTMIKGKEKPEQSTSASSAVDKTLDKDIRDRVARIPEFGPASDVSVFVRECRVIYNALVKDQGDQVELEFCRKLKLRLCSSYLEELDRQKTAVVKFDDFTEYMDAHHMSKKSAYQYMATISELEKRPDENIKDFALKVEAEVDRVATVIQAKFVKAKAAAKVKLEQSQDTATEMTAKDVFTLLAGSVVLAEVKKSTATYNAIINDLDACWSGREIALKAQAVSDRISNATDTVDTIHINHAKSAGSKSGTAGVCWKYLEGKDCPGGDCRFIHDSALRDLFKKQQQQPNRSQQQKSSNSNSGGGGGRRKRQFKPQANVANAEPAQTAQTPNVAESAAPRVNVATAPIGSLAPFHPRPLA